MSGAKKDNIPTSALKTIYELKAQLKNVTEELLISEERFQSLVLTIPDIIYRVDEEGRFTFINDAVTRLGYKPEELIGKHFSSIVQSSEKFSLKKVLPHLKEEETGDQEAPKLFDERRTGQRKTTGMEIELAVKGSKKGTPGLIHTLPSQSIVVEVNSSGMYQDTPKATQKIFIGSLGVIHDITDRKKMEENLRQAYEELEIKVEQRTADLRTTNKALTDEINERITIEKRLKDLFAELKQSQSQLIQAEKLGALGTLTAGIAHELNNPLMGMINFIQYCLKHTPDSSKIHPVLQDAERETKRCAEIVKNLLTFSRMDLNKEEPFRTEQMSTLLHRVQRLVAYRMEKSNIHYQENIVDGTPACPMRTSNIQQTLLNFIGNAMDAVSTSKKKEIRILVSAEDGMVRTDISDTGCGIKPENLGKIFDPFFTTKPPGKGTGLGLSVSKSIIEAHGGVIRCESREGEGTTFSIFLPVQNKSGRNHAS